MEIKKEIIKINKNRGNNEERNARFLQAKGHFNRQKYTGIAWRLAGFGYCQEFTGSLSLEAE